MAPALRSEPWSIAGCVRTLCCQSVKHLLKPKIGDNDFLDSTCMYSACTEIVQVFEGKKGEF